MDKKKGIFDSFNRSGIFKAMLIACVIIILAILAWTMASWSRMFEQFVRQGDSLAYIAGQTAHVESLKKCVNNEYNIAAEEFTKMLNVLGKTLQKYSVPFPQELNEAISSFRKKLGNIKECLIFPEDIR